MTVVAASAVITDDEGRFLLVLRGRDPGRGLWSLPGGKVEPGESPAQAVVREVAEETGLSVRVAGLRVTVRVDASYERTYEIHCFDADVTGGRLRAGDDADDVAWFDLAQIDSVPLTAGVLDLLRGSPE